MARSRKTEWRLRKGEQLKIIHGLLSTLTQSRPEDPNYGWQRPQLALWAEVVVIFQPPPKSTELAGADIRQMVTQDYYDLVAEAMGEVEAAQQDLWRDQAEPRGSRKWYQRWIHR
jgi:hypothetical protein